MLNHAKNRNYLVSGLFGGLVILLGAIGAIGTLSLVLTAIFVSSFALLILAEHNGVISIGKYMRGN